MDTLNHLARNYADFVNDKSPNPNSPDGFK